MRKVSKGNVTIKVFFPSLVVMLNQSSPSIKENTIMQLLIEFLVNIFFLHLQIWDIGGQPRFRSMWERYCRGVNAIVWAFWRTWTFNFIPFPANACTLLRIALACFRYMVDAADQEKVEASTNELHNLLDKPQLQGIPVSVDLKLILMISEEVLQKNFVWVAGTVASCLVRFLLWCVFRFWFSATRGISPLL